MNKLCSYTVHDGLVMNHWRCIIDNKRTFRLDGNRKVFGEHSTKTKKLVLNCLESKISKRFES